MPRKPDESTLFPVRPTPGAEALKALRAAEFQRICASVCELSAALFDLPMAFIRLYDGARLTTVAAFGVEAGALDALAFTERKLAEGEGLFLSDATRDPRFFLESAVLRGPQIRFYLDMPLVDRGEVLGVLSLAEPLPRHDFSDRKRTLFAQFAGQVATLVGLARSAEARNDMIGELQARQTRLDSASDMTGLGYWKIDLKTREVTWSKGLYALFGVNPKTYQPQVATQLDIYEPEDRATLIDRFQRAVNDGEDFDFELKIMRRKDKVMRLIRTCGGVEYDADGAPVRLCAVVRDVTPVSAEVAPKVETMSKDMVLGRVADELRAPLNDIIGFARRIETETPASAEIATYAHSLLTSANALKALFGAPEKPPVVEAVSDDEDADLEIVDVADVIRETVNGFADQAELHGTRLNAHFIDFTRHTAKLDVMRLQQVLQNLISNACKATRGGSVSVTASQVRAENPVTLATETHLHVSVRDSGAGMSEDRAHGVLAGQGGLGLSVARTIVEMLGGHIGIVSRPGEGTNAWFEIPVSWADAPVAAPEIRPAPRVDPKAAPVPRTLTRQSFDGPAYSPRPAYAPVRPRVEAEPLRPEPLRYAPVDEERINREYLRALLQDMKLDMQ